MSLCAYAWGAFQGAVCAHMECMPRRCVRARGVRFIAMFAYAWGAVRALCGRIWGSFRRCVHAHGVRATALRARVSSTCQGAVCARVESVYQGVMHTYMECIPRRCVCAHEVHPER